METSAHLVSALFTMKRIGSSVKKLRAGVYEKSTGEVRCSEGEVKTKRKGAKSN